MDLQDSTNIKSINDFLEVFPAGIILINEDFNIQFVNSNFFHFNLSKHDSPTELLGQDIFEKGVFLSSEINENIKALKEILGFETELKSDKTLTGGEISIVVKGVPLINNRGFAGGIIIIEDIMVSASTSDEKVISSHHFTALIKNTLDYFYLVNVDGEILYSKSGKPGTLSSTLKRKKFPNLDKIFHYIHPGELASLLESACVNASPATKVVPFKIKFIQEYVNLTVVPLKTGETITSLMVLVKQIKEPEPERNSDEPVVDTELLRYREITSSVLDAVVGMDIEGKINFWNDPATKLFGISKSEVYNKFIGNVLPSIDEEYFKSLVDEIKSSNGWNSEIKIFKDDGSEIIVSIRMGIINLEDYSSIVMLCSDITDRANSEKKLRLSEERFRNIITSTKEFICTLSLEGRINYVNPSFKNAFGYTDDDYKSKYFTDLINKDEYDVSGFDLELLSHHTAEGFELSMLSKSGKELTVLASITSVTDFNQNPVLYNVVLTDITKQKETHRDLLLTRSVFEASEDGICVIANRKIILANEFFASMFGYDEAEELIDSDPLDFVHEKDIPVIAKQIQERERGNDVANRIEFVGITKEGNTFDLENSIASYKVENITHIVFILRDITVEKISQKALEISEERYRSIAEAIDEFIWTAEKMDGILKAVLYTPAVERVTGYPAEQFLGTSKLWAHIIHPDDVRDVFKKIKGLYKDPARNLEELEYRIVHRQGNIVWLKNKISIVRDEDDNIVKVVGLGADITFQKKAEEEIQKSAEKFKELNDTKDRFISIISHDLRTPFSSILGFTDLLLNDREMPDVKQVEYIEFIQESSKSMLALVNSLLDWTRLQTGRIEFQPGKINSQSTIEKAIKMLKGAAIQKDINLYTSLQETLYIHADEGLLLQVFNNLGSNAIKFTPVGGTIEIGATAEMDKSQIEFYVKDNGSGIKDSDKPKLFNIDSKFTTPGTVGEKGSGLGLSLCYEIVNKHGGKIWVESELGKGSTFKFSIPISSSKILLVDDGKTDRILYAKLITGLFPDYKILFAQNGKEALDKVVEAQPALVITDHRMPVMNGYEFVKQLKVSGLEYSLPVIVLSSDINESISEEYRALGVEHIFSKPVNLQPFKAAIVSSLKKAIYN